MINRSVDQVNTADRKEAADAESELQLAKAELAKRTLKLGQIDRELVNLQMELEGSTLNKYLRKGNVSYVFIQVEFVNRIKSKIRILKKKRRESLEELLKAQERVLILEEEQSSG